MNRCDLTKCFTFIDKSPFQNHCFYNPFPFLPILTKLWKRLTSSRQLIMCHSVIKPPTMPGSSDHILIRIKGILSISTGIWLHVYPGAVCFV